MSGAVSEISGKPARRRRARLRRTSGVRTAVEAMRVWAAWISARVMRSNFMRPSSILSRSKRWRTQMAQTMATVYSCEPLGADEEDEDDFGVTVFLVIFSLIVGREYFSGEFFSARRNVNIDNCLVLYESDDPERIE